MAGIRLAVRPRNEAAHAQARVGASEAARPPTGEIARVAYELFERRGGLHGYDQQDWFEAERIVRARWRR